MRFHCAFLAAFVCAHTAIGADGVIEINEARVAAGGISSCDAPGYPVEICDPGSYKLVSDLHYPSATKNALILGPDHVSLDLNGMTIRGDNVCNTGVDGWVTSCTQSSGAGSAIAGGSHQRVSNGFVTGANGTCIGLGSDAYIHDVQVSDCSGTGVSGGERSRLRAISATRNGDVGVVAIQGSQLESIVVSLNKNQGIGFIGRGEKISANRNGFHGISFTGSGDGIDSWGNGDAGIVLGVASILRSFVSSANRRYGVLVNAGALLDSGVVQNNCSILPDLCAISGLPSGKSGYRAVVITSDYGGNSATACNMINLGSNTCQGGACPP